MRSIYEQALGEKFKLLHSRIQERFGFSSKDRRGSIGRGVMEKVWRGKFFTLPFLYVGSWRRIMFPEYGTNIPFTVRNYAYSTRSVERPSHGFVISKLAIRAVLTLT